MVLSVDTTNQLFILVPPVQHVKMAENDVQWLTSLSATALKAHIDASDSISLHNFPAGCKVSVDSRTYMQGILNFVGLSTASPHMVSLSLKAPGSTIALFLPPLKQQNALVEYDDAKVSLSFSYSTRADIRVGDRGVAVLPLSGRNDWDALASCICREILEGAEMGFGRCVHAPKFSKWPQPRPHVGATPVQITKFGMDATERVSTIMCIRHGNSFDRLLGECQLAFVGFLFIGCVESLAHWVFIVKEVCSCFDMFDSDQERVGKFMRVLGAQLKLIDKDVTVAFNGLGLRTAINDLVAHIGHNAHSIAVCDWLQMAQCDSEVNDEYGPTVVDMN